MSIALFPDWIQASAERLRIAVLPDSPANPRVKSEEDNNTIGHIKPIGNA